MQLVAYGAQDVYLTGNPQITFWKVTYRRYTNFAVESIEQTFNGQADFGRRVQCTISRNGDLAYRTYLQVTLPEINQLMGIASFAVGVGSGVYARWLDYPGEQLIAQVEVEIGGHGYLMVKREIVGSAPIAPPHRAYGEPAPPTRHARP